MKFYQSGDNFTQALLVMLVCDKYHAFCRFIAAHFLPGGLNKINANADHENQIGCQLHPQRIIHHFCGWPFVKSFAPCYDWALWAGGDDLPKSALNSNLAPDIKPCWTPPAPFVQQPGHQPTILALFVNLSVLLIFGGCEVLSNNSCPFVSIFPYFICGLIGLISQIIQPPH